MKTYADPRHCFKFLPIFFSVKIVFNPTVLFFSQKEVPSVRSRPKRSTGTECPEPTKKKYRVSGADQKEVPSVRSQPKRSTECPEPNQKGNSPGSSGYATLLPVMILQTQYYYYNILFCSDMEAPYLPPSLFLITVISSCVFYNMIFLFY